MTVKKPLLIIAFALFQFSASAFAVNAVSASTIPLSVDEEDTLIFIREEEKLARDVYLTMYDVYGSSIFKNIATSEQRHMDAIKTLLDKYQITDPAKEGIGDFTNQDLQNLYNYLIAQGSESFEGALNVGLLIEEKDLVDIQLAIDESNHFDLDKVYTKLLTGSKNHLRAFISQLEKLGIDYKAILH